MNEVLQQFMVALEQLLVTQQALLAEQQQTNVLLQKLVERLAGGLS